MFRVPDRATTWLALLLVTMIAGCAYQGPTGNVISQQLIWISYISGDDIRAQCSDRAPDSYRLIYNADRTRHARTYDILDVREGAVVEQMVDRGVVFESGRSVDIRQIGVPVQDRFVLSAAEFAELEALLRASGAFDPPPVGLRLASRGFYWIVSGCRDGRFFLTAFLHPSERFERIQFASFLEDHDRTGVRFPILPQPGRARGMNRCPRGQASNANNARCFWVEVGEDGLVGTRTVD